MFLNPSASSWAYQGPSPDPAIEAFHQLLPDYNITPLIELPDTAKELGVGRVLVKDESHRFGLPAFKILGASWAIYKAVASECGASLPCSLETLGAKARSRRLRLVACTEGNWGRATARMARYLQIPATVFVPKFMDMATQRTISSEGAEVLVVNGDYDMSIEAARDLAKIQGNLLVMDVSWQGYEEVPRMVVEGYSTMLAETDRQLQEMVGKPATHVIASVGVGSWAQAVTVHYKSKRDRATVVAVEPESAACLQESLKAGRIVSIKTDETIMNGMNCGTVSYIAWDVLRKGVDVCVTVSDLEAHREVEYLGAHAVPCGPCGAAPLAALRKLIESKDRFGLDAASVVVLFSTEGAREYEISK
ncbi:tryptophan synthase beta subunit-like PLP-dependent enzyme [Westerdykella ornata]|uniref:Tryptophan synthase beta subunit-like PLP-dependent enzyme n=1 Tax=Westerdykella ornata TaxID=318751 RepID=A0A6A6JFE8_WESOR|nr:tryptophan synthase beta subunit-like PLP-dependent enzyme [Westerdykella ornata]KAF2273909.1 tryptophan synthase beta subunit-like PLP-dependent enzyme [Westerdykella ornata]